VTVTDWLPTLPAASRAVTVTVCEPGAMRFVFQLKEIEEPVAVAFCTPSMSRASESDVLTLSDALAETLTIPDTRAPATGAAILTTGGVASPETGGGCATLTVTAADVATLPAASYATAVSVAAPFA